MFISSIIIFHNLLMVFFFTRAHQIFTSGNYLNANYYLVKFRIDYGFSEF